jgi:hypothetical protein
MSKTLLAPVAVAAALFLAACGGNTPANNTAAPADAPATTEPAPATPAPATPAAPAAPAN